MTFSNTFNGIPAGCIDCAIHHSSESDRPHRRVRHNFAFSIFRFADLLVNWVRKKKKKNVWKWNSTVPTLDWQPAAMTRHGCDTPAELPHVQNSYLYQSHSLDWLILLVFIRWHNKWIIGFCYRSDSFSRSEWHQCRQPERHGWVVRAGRDEREGGMFVTELLCYSQGWKKCFLGVHF